MKTRSSFLTPAFLILAIYALAAVASAQPPAQQRPAPQAGAQPTYHITMVPGTITAINYQNRTTTEIGFQGSPLLPLAKGRATVAAKEGRTVIDANFRDLQPAQKFGPEFLTYVLWAITPEGKANNLGELILDGDKSKTAVTTSLQTFGLIVTAEPYYAVSEPSDAVVLENVVVPETTGTIQQMSAKYQQLGRNQYSYDVSKTVQLQSKVPLEMLEARNAVEIANAAGAPQYASDAYRKAQDSLTEAEDLLKRGKKKELVQSARDAVQNAADARAMTITRIEAEQTAQEKADEAARTAQAQAEAATSAAKQKEEELAQQKAELDRKQAQLEAQQAAAQAQQAAAQAQQAEASRQEAMQREQQAQQAAQQAQQAAQQAEQEKEQLRATLLQQFNRVLPTTDTPRGLKANLADVLFTTGKYDLQPPAREALAKFVGILLAHPGLKLSVEGYTDNVGSDTYNQTLSENRGNAVRAYLIAQGIDPGAVTSVGFGKSNPVADNDTPAGRQQNRRVEIIISGEIIGTQIGGAHDQSAPPAAPQQ